MTRYIYIDDSYKNVFLRNSSIEQSATLKSVAAFMSDSNTENEEAVDKKLIVKGVSREEFKAFARESAKETYEETEYERWMNYIKMACAQGDTTLIAFDEEDSKGDISFFEKLVDENEEIDINELNNKYWLSYCLCDKSKKECEALESKYGISFIGVGDDVTKHEPDATFLVADKGYKWENMIHGRKCNTVFILDQYAFNPEDIMNVNIVAILKNIICAHAKLQVSAYTRNNNMNMNDIETKIKTELSKTNPNVSVNILSTGDIFHDRILITNNIYATVGGGFDSLKVEDLADGKHASRKHTTLHVYTNPAISAKGWLRNEYFGFINAISRQYEKFQQKFAHTGQPILTPNRLVRPIAEL